MARIVSRNSSAGSRRVNISVNDDLYERLKAAAGESDVSLSEYARQAVEYVLTREGFGKGYAPAKFDADDVAEAAPGDEVPSN